MIRIIDGRKYDTDTALLLLNITINAIATKLYLKDGGGYFLQTSAGITPTSENVARQWAERYGSAAQYDSAFGNTAE